MRRRCSFLYKRKHWVILMVLFLLCTNANIGLYKWFSFCSVQMQTLGNINGSVFALCLPVLVARYRIDTFMPRLPLTSKICIYGFNLECFTVLLEGICATLTYRHSEFLWKVSSATFILLKITCLQSRT